jgi:hypothetical protein
MPKRDDTWLYQLLDHTWDTYFSDVPQENDVRIAFGRKTKNRLGSIRVDPSDVRISIITLNGLFREALVPDFVIEATLVHELCHYAHGFNSPIAQKYRHPHAGGVMKREFAERGLEQLYKNQRHWLKMNWRTVVENNLTAKKGKTPARLSPKKVPKPFWFIG